MKALLAGPSRAIGRCLLPPPAAKRYKVAVITHSRAKARGLCELGAGRAPRRFSPSAVDFAATLRPDLARLGVAA